MPWRRGIRFGPDKRFFRDSVNKLKTENQASRFFVKVVHFPLYFCISKEKIMVLEQMYTNCLSEAAYFIASEGEAAVIDPLRDIRAYLALAEKHQVKIKYIFETHFHADFLSGHLELASKTGATIVFGPTTHAEFKFHKAEDEEQFSIGKLKLIALHTPGHTLESTCYLLQDETGKDYAVFTGDTLFVGDVGRPDLLGDVLSKKN